MRKRQRMSNSRSKNLFRRTAAKTKAINLPRMSGRGGIML